MTEYVRHRRGYYMAVIRVVPALTPTVEARHVSTHDGRPYRKLRTRLVFAHDLTVVSAPYVRLGADPVC